MSTGAADAYGGPLEYLTVRVSNEEIIETEDGRPVLSVPRRSIRTIHLAWGTPGERPVVAAVFGIAMLGMGFACLTWVSGLENKLDGWVLAGGSGLVVLGFLILHRTLRPKYYLDLRGSFGRRKVVFRGRVEGGHLAEFLTAIGAQLHCDVIVPPSLRHIQRPMSLGSEENIDFRVRPRAFSREQRPHRGEPPARSPLPRPDMAPEPAASPASEAEPGC